MLAIPLIFWLFPSHHTSGKHVFYLILRYASATVCEHFDNGIYVILGNSVSSHTLKHLLSAIATI